ncbi:MAG: DNA polymerase II large subunit [Methanobacteriota archaeon]|nr:MAG: DNA polymerase II large subunit [Euryarchaeota archaeon]
MSIPSYDKDRIETKEEPKETEGKLPFSELSKQYPYHQLLEQLVDEVHQIASQARAKKLDPIEEVEIYRAEDVASRTEGLVGPKGVAERLREMEFVEKLPKEQIVIKIAEEIALGKFGDLPPRDLAEQAIRTALSVQTEGITAAPIEGISKVKIKQNEDGSSYLAVYYSGPIRSAGGTAQGVSVLIADHVRKTLGLDRYKATDQEAERMLEEVRAYNAKVHLQLPTSDEEIRFAWKNLPVMISGDPTEPEEVSGYRNIESMETNRIRGGACLVLNDGVVGRAKKLVKRIKKIGLEGWEWLERIAAGEFSEFKETPKKKEDTKEEKKPKGRYEAKPETAFLSDAISGRPIFCGATRPGGFRLRYGHARNTGIAGIGIHPASYGVFNEFLAPGTHIRTERPGKGSIVTPIDTIRPPIVKLQSGDVIEVKTYQQGINLFPIIDKILFVGDLLIGYGEFVQNNYKLVPAGFNEEWWAQILKNAGHDHLLPQVSSYLMTKELTHNPPSQTDAIKIALDTKTPLHPKYVPAWKYLDVQEAISLRQYVLEADDELISPEAKPILEKALITHKIDPKTKKLRLDHFQSINFQLTGRADKNDTPIEPPAPEEISDGLEFVQAICPVPILDTMGTTLGARMGRPEKAKPRLMQPARHGLFPLGSVKGVGTDLRKAELHGTITVYLADRYCHSCKLQQYQRFCIQCGEPTEMRGRCITCGALNDEGPCDNCGGRVTYRKRVNLDMPKILNDIRGKIGEIPQKVKMIEELKNPTLTPEILEKGILRAKYGLHVFRDGTIRYDATDAPLTHFKPKEIQTPVQKLIELGYDKDVEGNPLVSDDQLLALKPQDIIVNQNFKEHAFNVARFVDDLLQYVYGLKPFYKLKSGEDIIGHLIIGLAPHTSAGVIGRIIGFTRASVCWAHPFWHSAKRRNCVEGSHEILLYNTTTEAIEMHPIGKIVENVATIQPGKLVDNFGTLEYQNPYPHLKAISLDEKSNTIILEDIGKWIKGKTDRWIKVTTLSGTELIMTPTHRQMVWKDNRLVKIKSEALQEGDLLPTPFRIHLPSASSSTLNLPETFCNKLPNTDKFRQFKNSLRLRGSGPTMRKILQKKMDERTRQSLIEQMKGTGSKPFTTRWYNSIPLTHLEILVERGVLSWNEIPKDASLGIARNPKLTPAYLELDADFFRFLGLYTAEGYIRDKNGTYQITIGNTNPALKKEIVRLSHKLCGTPYTKEHNVTNSNKIIAYLIAYAFGAGTSATNKRIPNILFSQPDENKIQYLSAVIDGDGSIVVQNKAIQIYTANPKLAADYRTLIATLGHKAKILTVQGHRFGKTVLQRYKTLGTQPNSKGVLYHVICYDTALLQKIKLLHCEKARKIKSILKKPRKFSRSTFISEDVFLDPIKSIEVIQKHAPTYCAEIAGSNHNIIFANSPITSNCDGDEDGIVLLMDGFLNFSKEYLPTTRGSKMDAPLVLVTKLNPLEVDDEAFNVDYVFEYPTQFYEATLKGSAATTLPIPRIENVLGTMRQFQSVPYTHYTEDIAIGPLVTKYKIIPSMKEKLYAQMDLAEMIAAVDEKFVAEQVLKRHFIPDLMGNLRAFAKQGVYCGACRAKYRRIPLTGKCLNPKCPKPESLRLNINPASVYKYLEIAQELIDRYHMRTYIQDRLDRIKLGIHGLFPPEEKKQLDLSDFF